MLKINKHFDKFLRRQTDVTYDPGRFKTVLRRRRNISEKKSLKVALHIFLTS